MELMHTVLTIVIDTALAQEAQVTNLNVSEDVTALNESIIFFF